MCEAGFGTDLQWKATTEATKAVATHVMSRISNRKKHEQTTSKKQNQKGGEGSGITSKQEQITTSGGMSWPSLSELNGRGALPINYAQTESTNKLRRVPIITAIESEVPETHACNLSNSSVRREGMEQRARVPAERFSSSWDTWSRLHSQSWRRVTFALKRPTSPLPSLQEASTIMALRCDHMAIVTS